jgi:hypothetical protein
MCWRMRIYPDDTQPSQVTFNCDLAISISYMVCDATSPVRVPLLDHGNERSRCTTGTTQS